MTLRRVLSTIAALGVFLALLAPQTMAYGRARIVAATFAIWVLANLGPQLWATIVACWRLELLLLAFLLAVCLKYLFQNDNLPPFQVCASAPIYGSLLLLIGKYYYLHDYPLLGEIRGWTLVLLALLIFPSLSVLYLDPLLVRFQSTDIVEITDMSRYLEGVGNYLHYTTIAIISPCCVALLFTAGVVKRAILLIAVAVLSISVVLSMLTMAAVLLFAGILGTLLVVPFLLRSRYRFLLLVGSAALLAVTPTLVGVLSSEFDAFRFVSEKFVRISQDTWEDGLLHGDETGRAEMFLGSWNTFCNNPLLGVPAVGQDVYIGGHSSLIDSWAIFGIIGYAPFFAFQVLCTRRAIQNWRQDRKNLNACVSTMAWGFFWICSAGNPMWSVFPAMLIFTDCFSPAESLAAMRAAQGILPPAAGSPLRAPHFRQGNYQPLRPRMR